ncbi:hypothetical protein ACF3NX_15355 (plasmid) [Acetobacter orientalis]|uniref:hypothetical protein n=1 Tax=Acetobacter orientalis TaxID=146474 RepID=UPI0038639E89
MVRQIFVSGIKVETSTRTFQPQPTKGRQLTAEQCRQRRSATYIEAVRRLDTGGPISGPNIAVIRDAVAAEFPHGPESWPLGWVSKCYLGAPYEVHIVDISGHIIQHFKRGEPLPHGMERARSLAASGQYAVIEVFSDRLVAIAEDGTTSVSMG